jgi:serine/threonine protein kinase
VFWRGAVCALKVFLFELVRRYMAPEILQEVGHSFAVDWWCLGILIYEMHTGCTPFVSPNKKEMYINILKNPPKYPASFPPLAKDLCNRLLHKDPKSRLGAAAGGGRDIQVSASIALSPCLLTGACPSGARLFQRDRLRRAAASRNRHEAGVDTRHQGRPRCVLVRSQSS